MVWVSRHITRIPGWRYNLPPTLPSSRPYFGGLVDATNTLKLTVNEGCFNGADSSDAV